MSIKKDVKQCIGLKEVHRDWTASIQNSSQDEKCLPISSVLRKSEWRLVKVREP